MADEPKTNEPTQGTDPKEPEGGAEPQQRKDEPRDRNGQPGINREKYRRDIESRDERIKALEAQLEEATGKGKTAEDRVAELSKSFEDLKGELADEKVSSALREAGCVDLKAAKARLGDFDGDVSKLRDECPYLFRQERQTGSTGLRHRGAPEGVDDMLDRAFGLKKK